MNRRRPVTDDERTRIAQAIKAGTPRNQIARDFNRSPSTITLIAKANELTFDRTMTKHATEARQADNQARRAELATKMLDDALKLREQLWEPAEYVSVTKDGKVVRYTMDRPTFSDQRNLAVSVKVLADGAAALEKINTPESAGSDVDGWLKYMLSGERPAA